MSETFFSENRSGQVVEQSPASPLERLATAEGAIVGVHDRLLAAEDLIQRQAAAMKTMGQVLAGLQAELEHLAGVRGAVALQRDQLAALARHLGVEFTAVSRQNSGGSLQ